MKNVAYTFVIALTLFVNPKSIQAQVITTMAGTAPFGFGGDGGAATAAKLHNAFSITADNSGTVYFSDYANGRIRKISTAGVITTIAGNGVNGFTGDGGPAVSAQLNNPQGITVNPAGTLLYIADCLNHRIRMINLSSGIINTVIGNGVAANRGDSGLATAAEIAYPDYVALDAWGNLYATAQGGNIRIRRVDAGTGIVQTVAGGGSLADADGNTATSVWLREVQYITLDALGNIFYSEPDYHVVRKIAVGSGTLSTVAGMENNFGYAGDGGPASASRLAFPFAIVADFSGNVFIADGNNNRVRKVSASTGNISTVAGDGVYTDNGDGLVATAAGLSHPQGMAIDRSGNMYVSDSSFSIRKITSITAVEEVKPETNFQLYPNPSSGDLCFQASGMGYTSLAIYDLTGRVIHSVELNAMEPNPLVHLHLDVPAGIYLVQIRRGKELISKKIVLRK
ncbi:MAG: T9SS type A sorting domain-containing protein [Bacteroidia bacterium]